MEVSDLATVAGLDLRLRVFPDGNALCERDGCASAYVVSGAAADVLFRLRVADGGRATLFHRFPGEWGCATLPRPDAALTVALDVPPPKTATSSGFITIKNESMNVS